jgi:hypothetical protein
MKDVMLFLLNNGFKMVSADIFSNDKCTVVITQSGYSVSNREGGSLYSDNLSIYWLIGALTYNGYIEKNYKI